MSKVFAGAFASLALAASLSGCFESDANLAYDADRCQRLIDRFTDENMDAGLAEPSDNLGQAIGRTGRAIFRIRQMEAELRRNGCPVGFSDNPPPMRPAMGDAVARGAPEPAPTPDRPEPPRLGYDPEPITQLRDDGY